jgi:hypothetical protein
VNKALHSIYARHRSRRECSKRRHLPWEEHPTPEKPNQTKPTLRRTRLHAHRHPPRLEGYIHCHRLVTCCRSPSFSQAGHECLIYLANPLKVHKGGGQFNVPPVPPSRKRKKKKEKERKRKGEQMKRGCASSEKRSPMGVYVLAEATMTLQ